MALPNVPGQITLTQNLQFNETDHEFERGNTEATLLASALRTVTTTATAVNTSALGGTFFLDITTLTTSATLQLSIQAIDPVGGRVATLALGAAQTTTGMSILVVHPGISTSAAGTPGIVPRHYQAVVTVAAATGGSSSATYSLGVQYQKA